MPGDLLPLGLLSGLTRLDWLKTQVFFWDQIGQFTHMMNSSPRQMGITKLGKTRSIFFIGVFARWCCLAEKSGNETARKEALGADPKSSNDSIRSIEKDRSTLPSPSHRWTSGVSFPLATSASTLGQVSTSLPWNTMRRIIRTSVCQSLIYRTLPNLAPT